MKSIDFAKVISAAAGSSLGVLSLIILALALLAYAFFRTASERARIGVFAAMFSAALGFGVSVLQEGQTRTVRATASTSAATNRSKPAAADPRTAMADSSAKGGYLSGIWRDDDGFSYNFRQSGERFSYEQTLAGEHAGSGEGSMVGLKLTYRYVDDRTDDRGTCKGVLWLAKNRIDGRCDNGQTSWGFKIERSQAASAL